MALDQELTHPQDPTTAGDHPTATPAIDEARVEEFAFTVAEHQAIATAATLVYVGDRLGLWSALGATGPVTATEFADRCELSPRYVAEWLATQAAIGYVVYEPATQRFTLPAAHAAVLADDDSPAAMIGGFEVQAAFAAVSDRLVDAFRSGAGIAWGQQDPRLFSGVARFFRPLYATNLVDEWLPALDGVVSRLEVGARVLDLGCGYGITTRLMAQAFPNSAFTGVDPHEKSVAQARADAEEAGLVDRVAFAVGSSEDDLGAGWDLVCFFDAFHHLGDPVAAARAARAALADDGTLMLVEPRARDRLEDNLDVVGLTFYGGSTLVCVPDALAQDGGHALGGQAGPARLAAVLTEAGFTRVRTALEADFNLVVEARP